MRARAALASIAVGCWAPGAFAHQPNNPEAHRSMPNQVFAGVTPICNEQLQGSLGGDTDLGSTSVFCIGVAIGFARELGRYFELRWRVGYEKPFPDDELLRDHLHVLRATMAFDVIGYRLDDRLTLTVGPEAGLFGAFVTSDELDTIQAFGWTVGVTGGVRTWVTYHAGFFWEVGAGLGRVSTDELELRTAFDGKITLGWADRF
jgi:hypothetical protein